MAALLLTHCAAAFLRTPQLSFAPHAHPHRVVSSARATAPASPDAVRKLLALAAPTDRGIEASEATRAEVSELIESLEAAWDGTDAFSTGQAPFLLRNTEVCYVGQSSSSKANAAGGKYRGRLGRALFRTEALFQHVLPDVAVNVIRFRLFGLIPGQAVLRGTWRRSLDSAELLALQRNGSRALSPNTIAVDFDSPRIQLGGVLNMQFGPSSRVGVRTTPWERWHVGRLHEADVSPNRCVGCPHVCHPSSCVPDPALLQIGRASCRERV